MLSTDHSLLAYNTFGIDVKADYFVRVNNEKQLIDILHNQAIESEILILGGGSNLLFTQNIPSLVIKNEISGRSFEELDDDHVLVRAGAGENWHEFVVWCLEHDFGGLENLSLIPGTVGAAPIQNIGAYGIELKNVFHNLRAINLSSGEARTFTAEQCEFGYRDSIFKRDLKGKYYITEVTFKLTRKDHVIRDGYGAIRSVLQEKGITQPAIKDIHQAVIEIRSSKLPDPAEIGNAGSFFKNPEVPAEHFGKIHAAYPDMPSYPGKNGLVKIPAGWLIEQCGWKGRRRGPIGCYEKQALILVNYGGGSGKEILKLSEDIAADVMGQFGIQLHREVNVL